MKIGILGSGVVAKTLAAGLMKYGHAVMVGTRDPAKLAEWISQTPGASVGSVAEAAAFSELMVLAVKGKAAAAVLASAGAESLTGKVVIDATNPIDDAPPVNGVLPFFTDHDESLMEELQRKFSGASFVKCFNSVGAASMVNPQFKEGKPTMFICGNEEKSKELVNKILDDFGWGQRTWAARKRHAPSSLYVCSGVSRAFCIISGPTRSSCWSRTRFLSMTRSTIN